MPKTKNATEVIELTYIHCGIGRIKYKTDNMLLEQVMEALSERLEKQSANEVLKLLES